MFELDGGHGGFAICGVEGSYHVILSLAGYIHYELWIVDRYLG